MSRHTKLIGLLTVLLLALLATSALPTGAQGDVVDAQHVLANWTAEYFNGNTIGGTPVVTRQESNPNNNWGYGSPAAGVNVDNFAARWSTNIDLPAGPYAIVVRADDGVRVYVDGIMHIDEWHLATNSSYTTNINITGGLHNIVIEYYEALEVAFINFDMYMTPLPPPTPGYITVTAPQLNVRGTPDPYYGQILTTILLGSSYPAVGRTADNTWIQISVNGLTGWVNAAYVSVAGLENLPITWGGPVPTPSPTPIPPPPPPPPGGSYVTVTAYLLNVRNIPDPYNGQILTTISRNQSYPAIGRNVDSSWIQINVNGLPGWVSGAFVNVVGLQYLPITYGGTPPPPPPPPPPPGGPVATVNTALLNVRSEPNPFLNNVLTQIRRGETYPLIGRTADSSWIQITIPGLPFAPGTASGWVNRSYMIVSSAHLAAVPVTYGGPPPTGAIATVTAYFLNVRAIPNPYYGQIVTRISRGQSYNIVGRTADNSWVQLNVNGTIGWVNSYWVSISTLQGVPITA